MEQNNYLIRVKGTILVGDPERQHTESKYVWKHHCFNNEELIRFLADNKVKQVLPLPK